MQTYQFAASQRTDLGEQQQQQQQLLQQHEQQRAIQGNQISAGLGNTTHTNAGMAAFVARLMSLSAHELQCLHDDREIMSHLEETQQLMESRLQQRTKFLQHQHQHQHQQHLNIHHQIQQQQQLQLAGSSAELAAASNCYQLLAAPASTHLSQLDQYYAQAIASAAAAAANQQQYNGQQHLLMAGAVNANQLALDLRTSQPAGYHHHHHLAGAANLVSPGHQQHLYSSLGSYYTASPSSTISSSPSSTSSSASTLSIGSSIGSPPAEQPQQQQKQQQPQKQRSMNPKKIKLDEYQQTQNSSSCGHNETSKLNNNLSVLAPLPAASNRVEPAQKRARADSAQLKTGAQSNSATSNNNANQTGGGKKYKGEFDEPTASEVEQRQVDLDRPEMNYHQANVGECACVLGSEFHNKSNAEMLAHIDRWRRLATEERIKFKWDLTDLPKDIPLSEIKKFEDLRRDASNGRADFGGASKRKPLGIRGTRQFLLILYCLWGHPGREDPMQKEGYCPHCFAKIKKANEQSTLVRVVNHFNMKHRRGANPRLSPHRDTLASAAASPQAPPNT